MSSAELLAQVDPERVTPGLLGFLVILAIGLATWGLLRSMNRQLGKIDVDRARPRAEADSPGEPDAGPERDVRPEPDGPGGPAGSSGPDSADPPPAPPAGR